MRTLFIFKISLLLLTFLCLTSMAGEKPVNPYQGKGIWISVDTNASTLSVMDGSKRIKLYEDVAFGRFGTTSAKRHKDGKTPLGEFKVTHIKTDSSFHVFIGINYPNIAHAEAGLKEGYLSEKEFKNIRSTIYRQLPPPQNTPLGGFIGIHGIGSGNPNTHKEYNWTQGCVAVTNDQIDELLQWVEKGTPVIIY